VVALKVLQRRAASRQAMKRFQHESEILGRLRHPNIAQIYDAGTFDDGGGAQPYFAMEFVKGRPLLQYCDHHGLDTRARLELFAKVCAAVQYAHHKGVIHRDLKPDNILVDDLSEPRILDFGIAKATDTDLQVTTLQTDIGQLIGTVPYMSPEQVTGDPTEIVTRSDVYSLGVVLYELVSGRLPHDLHGKTIPEAVRVIREDDPTPLSSINRVFRGDVETIVAKALEKEKDRRYQSPADLAGDVRHYLADEPIVARPASTFYQLRKFARRNKALAGGTAIAFAALSVGTIIATWQAVQARAAANKATAINEYFLDLFAIANPIEQYNEYGPDVSGPRVLTIAGLLDEAAASLETSLGQWPDILADMHLRVGKNNWGLARRGEVMHHLVRAYELRASTLGETHPDTLLVATYIGGWHETVGTFTEAEVWHRRAVVGLMEGYGPSDRRTLAASIWLGSCLGQLGKVAEAEQVLLDTLEKTRELFGENDRLTLNAVLWYSTMLWHVGRDADAELALRAGLDVSRRALGADDLVTASMGRVLGLALVRMGRPAEAITLLREARESHRRQGADKTYTYLDMTRGLCRALESMGQGDEAEAITRTVLDEMRRELGERHDYTYYALGELARRLRWQDRNPEALSLLREAQPESWAADNVFSLFLMEIYGNALRDADELVEAELWFERSLAGREQALGETNTTTLRSLRLLAQLARRQDNVELAQQRFRELVRRSRELGDGNRYTPQYLNMLAWTLKNIKAPGKLAEAEDVAREAASLARSSLGDDDRLTANIVDTLAVILYLRGRYDDAITEFERAAAGNRTLLGNRWLTGMSAIEYGECLIALDRIEDAKSVLETTYEGYLELHGEDHKSTQRARAALADLEKRR
jgi:tetratricopeptide (TPR) repeat protein